MFHFPDAKSLPQSCSLKWQTSLPAFIDHWKIAELSLSSKVGGERADSTL